MRKRVFPVSESPPSNQTTNLPPLKTKYVVVCLSTKFVECNGIVMNIKLHIEELLINNLRSHLHRQIRTCVTYTGVRTHNHLTTWDINKLFVHHIIKITVTFICFPKLVDPLKNESIQAYILYYCHNFFFF